MSPLRQLLMCFKVRLICHSGRGGDKKKMLELAGAGEAGGGQSTTRSAFRGQQTRTHRHPHKTALWSCSLLPFQCYHPSMDYKRKSTKYLPRCPLHTPPFSYFRTEPYSLSFLSFIYIYVYIYIYIYVYMYTIGLGGC